MENDDVDFKEIEKSLDVEYDEIYYEPERFIKLEDFLEIDDENYYKY